MAKKTPMQEVKERFGSKEELAKLLYEKLERPYEDESQEDFELRIRTASNKKLLRLHRVHEEAQERFGGKDGLVDAVMKMRYPVGNPRSPIQSQIGELPHHSSAGNAPSAGEASAGLSRSFRGRK